jgi:stage II sporulation protein AB (anti-sigma F factor)
MTAVASIARDHPRRRRGFQTSPSHAKIVRDTQVSKVPGRVTQLPKAMIESARFSNYSIGVSDRPYVRESFPAVEASIPLARNAITEWAEEAGADREQIDQIRLAVSEALTNVVLYAYPWRTGEIHVTARVPGNELWVLIADSGCGIHAGRDSEGLGLGLALISKMTDGFSVVERSSGGTELRLRFCSR